MIIIFFGSHDERRMHKKIISIVACLLFFSALHAANFSIVPMVISAPTEAPLNQAYVYYVITNNTNVALNGYQLVGLPSSVQQSTT